MQIENNDDLLQLSLADEIWRHRLNKYIVCKNSITKTKTNSVCSHEAEFGLKSKGRKIDILTRKNVTPVQFLLFSVLKQQANH